MTRKKVKLQYMVNGSARRATFRKRLASLMKKASELVTLCDVDACVVVYGEGEESLPPVVWPPSATDAARILGRFRDMPEVDRCKKMMDMEGFTQQRVAKLRQQLEKAQRENRARETALLLHDAIAGRRPAGLAGLSSEELASLKSMVEKRLEEVTKSIQRLELKQGNGDRATSAPQLSPASRAPSPAPCNNADAGHTEVVNAPKPDPQGGLSDMTNKAGGLAGESWVDFGGDFAGASTSGGLLEDMLLHVGGNTMAGRSPSADQGPSFPPSPTM